MRKPVILLGLACLAALGLATGAWANSGVRGEEPGMMVSPQTIVLAKVSTVTVHTNIPADTVVGASLELDGAAALEVWADDLGDVAARFAVADLGLAPADAVVLTLTGFYTDGSTLLVEDTVRVK